MAAIATVLLGAAASVPAVAQETKMTGAEISDALTGKTAIYSGGEARQFFAESGQTPYWDGKNMSSGSWRVTGDQYCSAWPPSPNWACYNMVQTDGGEIVWVGSGGGRYPATMVDGDQMAAQ